jgi:hypothetical protein
MGGVSPAPCIGQDGAMQMSCLGAAQMIRLFRRHPVLMAVLSLSLCLALFFAGRFTVRALYWESHREEAVAGWMTVGYVGRSWGIDPREIDARAGLPLPDGHPLTLDEIARERGVPVAEVVALVEAAVAALRAERGAQDAAKDDAP